MSRNNLPSVVVLSSEFSGEPRGCGPGVGGHHCVGQYLLFAPTSLSSAEEREDLESEGTLQILTTR